VTRADLAAIRSGKHKTTRATVASLCDAIEAILDVAQRGGTEQNPWGLAQILLAKSIQKAVESVPLA